MTAHSLQTGTPAPVAVFAFRRPELLQRTLASLQNCDRFSETPLHVFSEAARADDPVEVAEVARVRTWVRDWSSIHHATVHEAPAKNGLRQSIISGVSMILESHDRVIVLEDDLLLSPAFLIFMNEALETCKDRDDIVQVSGYFVPHKRRLPAVGLLSAPGSWGWGTWRRAWQHYRDDAASLLKDVLLRDTNAFDIHGTYANLAALERNATGSLDTWLVRWHASVFLRDGLTLYPARSLTRNIGFGREATNCKPTPMDRVYTRQRIQQRPLTVNWAAVGTEESPEFAETLAEFYRWQQHQWTKPTWPERIRAKLGQ